MCSLPFDILEPLSDRKNGFSDYVGQNVQVGSCYDYLLWVLAYIVRKSIISSSTQMFGMGVA